MKSKSPPPIPADPPAGAEPAKTSDLPTHRDGPGKDGSGRRRLAAGAAMGIGSAALVAALLYANRHPRKKDRDS